MTYGVVAPIDNSVPSEFTCRMFDEASLGLGKSVDDLISPSSWHRLRVMSRGVATPVTGCNCNAYFVACVHGQTRDTPKQAAVSVNPTVSPTPTGQG
jgi:hypothetical protein